MQQRGAMLALRACADQLGPLAQQAPQRLLVAVHDRLRSSFEGSTSMREGIEVRAEPRPALEAVGTGDHELRVGKHAASFPGRHDADRELLDLGRRAIARPLIGVGKERRDPAIGPRADGVRGPRAAGLDQVLGEFAVLLEAGAGGKR